MIIELEATRVLLYTSTSLLGAMKAAGIIDYAEIIKYDRTNLLGKIKDRLDSLRAGNRIESSLMCQEEKRFMWNLAFFFTIKHRAAAFKAFYAIRSFTLINVFMGHGRDKSKWGQGIGYHRRRK